MKAKLINKTLNNIFEQEESNEWLIAVEYPRFNEIQFLEDYEDLDIIETIKFTKDGNKALRFKYQQQAIFVAKMLDAKYFRKLNTAKVISSKVFDDIKMNESLTPLKITKEIIQESPRKFKGYGRSQPSGTYVFKANGIPVANYKIYYELYDTPSERLRTVSKLSRSLSWDRKGIKELTGFDVSYKDEILQNDHPDTRYGYTGSAYSLKDIKDLINAFIEKEQNK